MNNRPITRREWIVFVLVALLLIIELMIIFHPKDQTGPVRDCTFSTPC